MGVLLRYYGGFLLRAVVFIASISGLLWGLTRNRKIVLAYCGAHLGAIMAGGLVDAVIIKVLAPRGPIPLFYMEMLFFLPVVLFTSISLWIAHWEAVLHLGGALMAMLPFVAWGCLVVWGPQDMSEYDVLGAWFVSAGCGGVDLAAHYGGPALRSRPWRTKTLGHAAVVLGLYLLLPLSGL